MNKILQLFLIVTIFLSSSSTVSAYGGGGGLPGFPPPSHIKLICKYDIKTINLPFNRERQIRIPRCHVERTKVSNNEFKNRLANFLSRIRDGR